MCIYMAKLICICIYILTLCCVWCLRSEANGCLYTFRDEWLNVYMCIYKAKHCLWDVFRSWRDLTLGCFGVGI
jgi:hypothetical protein